MAHLATIVGCSKRCSALNWVAYDSAFRRKAAGLLQEIAEFLQQTDCPELLHKEV